MENINFSFNEICHNEICHIDLSSFLPNDTDNYDIEIMLQYYSAYTVKSLVQILHYYGLQKNKMVKEEMLQVLLFFESDPQNKSTVERRMRLWRNIQELKLDPYFSKYIFFSA